MSETRTSQWLLSNNPHMNQQSFVQSRKAVTVAIASGKGGVGKTSITLKLAKTLKEQNKKVLIIDCDFNLSNTAVKLGLPIKDSFYEYLTGKKSLNDIIFKDGNFHLLPTCNGNLEFLNLNYNIEKIIIDIIHEKEKEYDFILLDCSAGINKSVLTLCSYCDRRVVVITPDKSSLTDSYSLLKILKQSFGVNENHIILNKLSNQKQYLRLVKTLSKTVEQFLSSRINILGGINLIEGEVDYFDQNLLNFAGSKIESQFLKVIKKLSDECDDRTDFDCEPVYQSRFQRNSNQEVRV